MITVFIFLFLIIVPPSYPQINVYFTDPYNKQQPSLSSISTNQKPIDFALKDFILSATAGTTMYVCIYEVNNTTVTTAIDSCVNNGVKVYAIFDQNVSTNVFKSSFNWKKLGSSSQLMHNKFVVLKSSKVWTGSYNFTVSATYEQDNFAVEIFSKEVAEIYENAFWYMWNGTGNINEFNGKTTTLVDRTKISVYFNPYSQNPQLKDVLINNWYDYHDEQPVVKKIYFTVAWFTDNNVGIVDCFRILKEKNVEIYGIIDDDDMNFNVYQQLRNLNIEIYFDSRKTTVGSGLMHHKFCVLDPYGEKPRVICGSANWSDKALTYGSNNNYENMLVIESRNVAETFYKEFLRLYSKVKTKELLSTSDEMVEEILFYPNPVKEKLYVKFRPNVGVNEIKFLLVSLYGVKIIEKDLNFVCGIENKAEVELPKNLNGLYNAVLHVKSYDRYKDYVRKVVIKN